MSSKVREVLVVKTGPAKLWSSVCILTYIYVYMYVYMHIYIYGHTVISCKRTHFLVREHILVRHLKEARCVCGQGVFPLGELIQRRK